MKPVEFPQAVRPVQTPAAYRGGKKTLSHRIVDIIAGISHKTYAEPFVGMGGVFFRRTLRPKSEVINDLNGEVSNLFRILQRHYPQLIDSLRFQICSRVEFERLRASSPSTLTDLERAARFLYLQRLAFGGKVVGQTFGVSPHLPARFDPNRLAPLLADVHERLAGVVIENLPWEAFVDRYDRRDTLFYLDPPYWGGTNDYGKNLFDATQFDLLADRLARLKGRFVLSINDVPEIRSLFGRFAMEPIKLNYSISRTRPTPARELIVTG